MNRCPDGHDHDAIKASLELFRKLEPVPGGEYVQRFPKDETGPRLSLELRNCTCGSTLTFDITAIDDLNPNRS